MSATLFYHERRVPVFLFFAAPPLAGGGGLASRLPGFRSFSQIYFTLTKYAEKHGATEASIRYRISRKTVHKWLKRYDGTLASLEDRSHKPHHSPKAHTEEEILAIVRRLRRHGWKDLILVYQELVENAGYTRSYGGFKRVAEWLKKGKVE